jgi:hypothetical protein
MLARYAPVIARFEERLQASSPLAMQRHHLGLQAVQIVGPCLHPVPPLA